MLCRKQINGRLSFAASWPSSRSAETCRGVHQCGASPATPVAEQMLPLCACLSGRRRPRSLARSNLGASGQTMSVERAEGRMWRSYRFGVDEPGPGGDDRGLSGVATTAWGLHVRRDECTARGRRARGWRLKRCHWSDATAHKRHPEGKRAWYVEKGDDACRQPALKEA